MKVHTRLFVIGDSPGLQKEGIALIALLLLLPPGWVNADGDETAHIKH